MKFIITESQKDRAIFKYLDSLGLIIIEKEKAFYFVSSEEDDYAKIKYNKKNGYFIINEALINEVSSFFSFDNEDSVGIIGRWVEDTLQMNITKTISCDWLLRFLLNVPKN